MRFEKRPVLVIQVGQDFVSSFCVSHVFLYRYIPRRRIKGNADFRSFFSGSTLASLEPLLAKDQIVSISPTRIEKIRLERRAALSTERVRARAELEHGVEDAVVDEMAVALGKMPARFRDEPGKAMQKALAGA